MIICHKLYVCYTCSCDEELAIAGTSHPGNFVCSYIHYYMVAIWLATYKYVILISYTTMHAAVK